jgi:hypothetical protein
MLVERTMFEFHIAHNLRCTYCHSLEFRGGSGESGEMASYDAIEGAEERYHIVGVAKYSLSIVNS